MDQESNLNVENPEEIRHQMDETRASLTEKLETLEEQVRETVDSARSTVEDTIQSVRSGVEETVETVKHTFDVEYQVNHHPWAMLGASVLAGFVAGKLLSGNGHAESGPYSAGLQAGGTSRLYEAAAAAPVSERPSFLSGLVHQFDDEIDQLKGVAIGALLGMARDSIKNAVPPSLADQVGEVMDSISSKLGGQAASHR